MSLSNPNDRPVSPCARFFEFNGAKGIFMYYDKDAPHPTDPSKKGAKIECPLPFHFIVLDQLTTIKGWSDADQSGIWSNEIRDLKTGILQVRTKKGLQVEGIYEAIKGKVVGADYTKSVYIAFKDGDELKIGNVGMGGAALNAWIEFAKESEVVGKFVTVASCTDEVKGAVHYKKPVFSMRVTPEKHLIIATELDRKLQAYLTAYFTQKPAAEEEAAPPLPSVATPVTETPIEVVNETMTTPVTEPSAKEIVMEKSATNAAELAGKVEDDLPWD